MLGSRHRTSSRQASSLRFAGPCSPGSCCCRKQRVHASQQHTLSLPLQKFWFLILPWALQGWDGFSLSASWPGTAHRRGPLSQVSDTSSEALGGPAPPLLLRPLPGRGQHPAPSQGWTGALRPCVSLPRSSRRPSPRPGSALLRGAQRPSRLHPSSPQLTVSAEPKARLSPVVSIPFQSDWTGIKMSIYL